MVEEQKRIYAQFRPVIDAFDAPIDMAVAYGSGVVKQANKTGVSRVRGVRNWVWICQVAMTAFPIHCRHRGRQAESEMGGCRPSESISYIEAPRS